MNLNQTNDQIAYLTTKASEITRQLCLGGLAVIWLFTPKGESAPEITSWLALLSAISFIISIISDLGHYVVSAEDWIKLHKKKEVEVNYDTQKEFTYDPEDLKTTKYFYWGKLTFMIIGYLLLMLYVAGFVHLTNPFCNCPPSP